MFKVIDKFALKLEDKLKFYYIVTTTLFLIFGAPDLRGIIDKLLMIVCVTIGMFFFPGFIKVYMKMQSPKLKSTINKVSGIIKIQFCFFQVFGIMIVLLTVASSITGQSLIALSLLASNIGLKLVVEVAKIKEAYFGEHKEVVNEVNLD